MNPQGTAVHINQQNQITKNCDRSKGDFTNGTYSKNVISNGHRWGKD